MTLFGMVYDTTTEQGIPNASLVVFNSAGTAQGGGVSADGTGYFQITSPVLDQGGKLQVSSVGYSSVLADPATIASTGFIGLQPAAQNLPAAVVTATVPASPASGSGSLGKAIPYVAAGGLILWALWPKKKKRTAAVGDVADVAGKIIIPAGILVGGYYAGKAILQKLGIINSGPTADQKATSDAQNLSLSAAVAAAAKSGTAGQTYPSDNYAGWANDIYNRAINDYTLPVNADDQAAIMTDIMNVQTNVDMQMLITAFGQRQGNCSFFGFGCTTYDLNSWVRAVLSPENLADVNTYLGHSNINYYF